MFMKGNESRGSISNESVKLNDNTLHTTAE